MGDAKTITAVVTGAPTYLRRPQPLPGETLARMVIRNRASEWSNLIQRLSVAFGASEADCQRLRSGDLKVTDLRLKAEISRFMNHRLPSYARTIDSLVGLRDYLKKAPATFGLDLIEILWPMVRRKNGEDDYVRTAETLGVKVLWLQEDAPRQLELRRLLPHIGGEYFWLVPGCTVFMGPLVELQLSRVVKHLASSPAHALYADNASSIIWRTEILRSIANTDRTLPADVREMARLLRELGYRLALDNDKESALCKLEREYGGDFPFKQRQTTASKPWWRRWI